MRSHIIARRLAVARRPLNSSPSTPLLLHRRAPPPAHVLPPSSRPLRHFATAALKEQDAVVSSSADATSVPGSGTLQEDLREIYDFLDSQIGGPSTWRDRIRKASEDLQAVRRGRIAVYGDTLAAPHDVVTAMLQDPLSYTESALSNLRTRHARDRPYFLHTARSPTEDSIGIYAADSPFLQNTQYDLLEISTGAEDVSSLILSADATVVVVDPIRLLENPLMEPLLSPLLSGHPLHIVVNGVIPSTTTQADLERQLSQRIDTWRLEFGDDVEPDRTVPRIFFIDAQKALQATADLAAQSRADSSSVSFESQAVARFQATFSESRVGPLLSSLVEQCRAMPMPQLSSAYRIASLALEQARTHILADRKATEMASRTVSELRHSARQSIARARHMSIITKGIEGGIVAEGIETEMAALKAEMEERFKDRWSWLALVARLRVDDIANEVGGYVQRSMATELARTITFETGELAQLQRQLGAQSDKVVRDLSDQAAEAGRNAPFFSPLLTNSLSTLTLSVPQLSPSSLTEPIETRRQQILRMSVPRLQVSATRALLGSWLFAGSAALANWAAYVSPLEVFSGPTALGLGILGAVTSLSLGQRWWLRAQRRFWRDWDRINGMLRGDLEVRLNTVIDTQVAAKPHAAADGLEQLVGKRQERLDELQAEVGELQARLFPIARKR